MLTVELNLAKILSFRGSRMRLSPGENEIPEDLFLEIWNDDPTIKFYFEERAFTVKKDGEPWSPDGKTKQAEKPPVEVTHAKVPSVDVQPEENKPEPPPPAETNPIPPRRMGGGVPGNSGESKARISETSDTAVLGDWLENETRSTVRRAIRSRLSSLEA